MIRVLLEGKISQFVVDCFTKSLPPVMPSDLNTAFENIRLANVNEEERPKQAQSEDAEKSTQVFSQERCS